jgi:tetrahydromethanopterin S-methyltransferase subunit A
VLRNIDGKAVEHFRRTVEVVDLIGCSQTDVICAAIRDCVERNPGPAEPFSPERVVEPSAGYVPERMVPDPLGYLVVYVDQHRQRLSLEHYKKNGVLDAVIEGRSAAELYMPAVEIGLVSRLDHAAYLGQELARAERALLDGQPYVQDAAPEQSTNCGCGSTC